MTGYVVYDVFTDEAFGGNPLAVVPNATGLEEADLLRITREFNLSETTFVYPPDDPAHDAKVRIFSPGGEMRFAGHPTIGTALALRDLGRVGNEMVLELGVGPIPVSVSGATATFVTRVPLQLSDGPAPDLVARMIGQGADCVRTDRHPPVTASLGAAYVLAELTGTDALAAAVPEGEAFREAADMGSTVGLYVYCRSGAEIRARMFAPLAGVVEDPATGSAAAALVSFLGRLEGRSQGFGVVQGVEMGRPGLIRAEVTVENGEPVSVAVSGAAVKVMEGRLVLPGSPRG